MDTVKVEWNCHRIAPSRNRHGPFGRPVIMYGIPEVYGVHDFLVPVQLDEVEVCETECTSKSALPCDKDVFDLGTLLMTELGVNEPKDAEEGVSLYHFLRSTILQQI